MQEELNIQEVAELTGLSVHTLRYYERIGLLRGVERASNGHRRYSQRDIAKIVFLNKLRATGMHIRQMLRWNELYHEGDHTIPARIELLVEHQREVEAQIATLTENLDAIRKKISIYHQRLDEISYAGDKETVLS